MINICYFVVGHEECSFPACPVKGYFWEVRLDNYYYLLDVKTVISEGNIRKEIRSCSWNVMELKNCEFLILYVQWSRYSINHWAAEIVQNFLLF